MALKHFKSQNWFTVGMTGASILAITLAVFVSGCGKSSDEVRDDIDREAQQLSITDSWLGSCQNASLDVFGVSSETQQYDFTDKLTKRTILYKEDSCVNASIDISESGTYVVGSKTPSEAFLLDLNFQTVAITPVTDEGRDLLNTIQACGINDWATGQQRDVTANTSDDPILDRCWTKTPRQVFDIVQVTGDEMVLGLEESGLDKSTQEKRPTRVDQSRKFSRQ